MRETARGDWGVEPVVGAEGGDDREDSVAEFGEGGSHGELELIEGSGVLVLEGELPVFVGEFEEHNGYYFSMAVKGRDKRKESKEKGSSFFLYSFILLFFAMQMHAYAMQMHR